MVFIVALKMLQICDKLLFIKKLLRGFVLVILLGNLIKLVILVYPTHSSVISCFSGSKKVWVLLSYWYRYTLEYQQLD